jgi:HK97 family phage portal protein
MGILQVAKELFNSIKTKGLNSQMNRDGMQFIPTDSVGNYTVLSKNNSAYNKIGIVYHIVSKIARRVGDASIEHYKDDEDHTEIKDSEILKRLKKPNPKQTFSQFFAEIASYKLLDGEYYIWKEKGGFTGKLNALWCVPSNLVTKIKGGGYNIGGVVNLPDEDIFHYRDFVPGYFAGFENNNIALSPIEVAGINLRVIDYASAASYKTLKNGNVQGVAYEEPMEGLLPPTDADTDKLKELLVKTYNNGKYGEVVVSKTPVGYTKFGLNPGELMILENILFNEERICDIFNYPRILLGDKGGTLGGNIRQEAKKEFITDAVFPILANICQSLEIIFGLENECITFDKDAFPEMQIDWVSTSQALDRMWYLTPNQKLKVLGYEASTDPSMDIVFAPNNITPIEDIANGGGGVDVLPTNTGDYGNN